MTSWDSLATPIAATYSKSPRMFAKNFVPTAMTSAVGSWVTDDDGHGYTDWISGLGAITLGNGYVPFCNRVAKQVYEGIGFSLPHVLEAQVAEKIVNLLGARVPDWTPAGLGVRFGLSGTDATTMAVRLARAVTGRSRILVYGYHGWSDTFVGATPPAWGVVPKGNDYIQEFRWNDGLQLAGLMSRCHAPVAAVIIEQPMEEPNEWFYGKTRRLCDDVGALFILDEVVTWPRYSLGGAAELYGIEPDIVCLGKGLGNGLPISCIVGRREYFQWFARNDPCFVSSTHFGNAVSLAAADAVLDLWNQDCVDHIWRIGQALMDGLREAGYQIQGNGVRFLVQHTNESERTYFTLRLRDFGILANRPWLVNYAHTVADVERTVVAARTIKQEMGEIDVVELMKDRLPMVLFTNR